MMRTLLLLACLLVGVFANAQELKIPKAHYPVLPKSGSTVDDFVPKGWVVEIQAKGDLNNDGLGDFALLLHENNPKNIVKNGDTSVELIDTNPRILVVIFGKKEGSYFLVLENHALIPRYVNPLIVDFIDPDSISIERGILRINLHIFPVQDSIINNITYIFHWQNKRFELIGHDSSTVYRSDGRLEKISINYSTGKGLFYCGNIADEKEAWKAIPNFGTSTPDSTNPTYSVNTIETIGNGIESALGGYCSSEDFYLPR